MTTKRTLFLLLFIPTLLLAQDPTPYAALIEGTALKENLSIIASDALEGRMTGSRGQKMAAAFIQNHFATLGLIPINNGSYYQQYSLYSYRQGEISIATGSKKFATSEDVVFYGSLNSNGPKEQQVVFVGAGADEEISQVDVKGRLAMLFGADLSYAKLSPIVGKLSLAGASGVIIYGTMPDEEYKTLMRELQGTLTNGRMSLERASADEPQIYFVSKAIVENLFGDIDKLNKTKLKRVKVVKATFNTEVTEDTVLTENVMGYLEGTDKKDEVILITAHYDHIGLNGNDIGDRVNNGADDDGSGTVTVLQLATAFTKAKKDGHGPRRSILFMTVTGEELGLYGSQYYTDTKPVVPLSKTVVDLNIDMIGRWDESHKGKAPYVYVIGADKLSSELQEISVRNNEKYTKLEFDYTYNDEHHPTNLYQRSDHWNFAKHGVPIVFYFDGIHEDYHSVSDEVSKIDFDILVKRGQCVFYTAWDIANRNDRLKVDK